MYPNESRPSTLKRCSDLDKEIRKMMVEVNLLKKSTTRSLVYLQTSLSGLGLKSIRFETEIHYIKKGIYLEYQPERERIKERFVRLAAKGWRNPITDAQSVRKNMASSFHR